MMIKNFLAYIVCALALTGVFCGCSTSTNDSLKDGYYTAEMADFSNGWKEFVTIHIEDNTIVSVEYNAKNASGFIKSWDMGYMRKMNAAKGTYPNYYTRAYARQVVEKQSGDNIDTVAGASMSGGNFRLLIPAALNMSQQGKNEVAIVQP
ncbi:MAG TPA: FMN-binding protein [Clostridia bacterium]|nr:FMN-binding protein [Clostridia bacterium]